MLGGTIRARGATQGVSGGIYLLVFTVAAAGALAATPLAGRLGRALGLVDRPGGRRRHQGEVPRLGGIGPAVGFFVALGAAFLTGALTQGYSANDALRLRGLWVGGLAALLFGLLDDRFDLAPRAQLLLQTALGAIAVGTLLWLERFTLPVLGYVELDDYAWGAFVYIPLTLFWTVGMINTVNWLDGLDGLAGGVGAIVCLVLAVHMHRVGQGAVALLPLALCGALAGFLPYNLAPARVFLGSGGAYFLGYALAGLGLIAGGRIATVLLVLAVPIVDVLWQIVDRLRAGRSAAQADRGHLHYRLLDRGLSQRTIVALYWGLCAVFGVLALTVSSRIVKLLTLAAIALAVIGVLALLSRRRGR